MSDIGKKLDILDKQLFDAMNVSEGQGKWLNRGVKLFVILFMIWSTFTFVAFLDKFDEMGCEAYCETKSLGIENKTYVLTQTLSYETKMLGNLTFDAEHSQYSIPCNPLPNQNPVPTNASYQNLDSNNVLPQEIN